MIQKIAFNPQIANAPEKEINFKGVAIKEEAKQDNSALLYGSLAALGAFGVGMLIRKPKVVEKTVERTVEKVTEEVTKASKKTKKTAKKLADEVSAPVRKSKKSKPKRQTTRQILDNASKDKVTPEMQAAYDKEIAYQAPTAEQRKAIDELHKQNQAERAEKNTIENLAHVSENKQPKQPVENPELKGIEGTIKNLKQRIAGAKKFGKDTSKLEAQLNNLIEKRDNLLKKTV